MKRGPIIHGVLLLVALIFAYQTWTREKKVTPKVGAVAVWSVAESAITAIVYDTEKKTVRLERRSEGGKSYFWGTETQTRTIKKRKPPRPKGDAGPVTDPTPEEEVKTTTRQFAVGEAGENTVKALAEFRALRNLGQPSDEDLKEFGLENGADVITLTHQGGVHSLTVGGSVFGGKDRYVRDPSSGNVYLVAGSVVKDLLGGYATLRLREVHAYKHDEIGKAVVTAGPRTRTLVQITVDDDRGKKQKTWADAETPDKPDQTMSNFLQNIAKLKPNEFDPEVDPKSLTLKVKVSYQRADGSELGWLELYEKAPEEEPEEPADKTGSDGAEPGAGGKDAAAKDPSKSSDKAAGKDPAKAAGKDAAKPDKAADKAGDKTAEKPEKKPPKKKQLPTYYIRTELTRTYAVVPRGTATRVTEDIDQLFAE